MVAGLEGVAEVHTAAADLRRAAAAAVVVAVVRMAAVVYIAAEAGVGRTGAGHTAAAGRREADHMEAGRTVAAAGRMVAAGRREARHSRVHLRCNRQSAGVAIISVCQELTSYLLAAACLRSWPSALRTS